MCELFGVLFFVVNVSAFFNSCDWLTTRRTWNTIHFCILRFVASYPSSTQNIMSTNMATLDGLGRSISDYCSEAIKKREMDPASENIQKIRGNIWTGMRKSIGESSPEDTEVETIVSIANTSVPIALGNLSSALYAELKPDVCDSSAWDGIKSVIITIVVDLHSGKVKSLVFVSN
jgi:hypothetical protein